MVPPLDEPSPSPALPSTTNKRPRPSGGGGSNTNTPAAGGSADTPPAAASRSKRKKPDTAASGSGPQAWEGMPASGPGSRGGRAGGRNKAAALAAAAAAEADKDRDDEGGGVVEGEIITKIDFKTLPPETLYKYLEHYELLPKWNVSPWSEDPVTQPHMLYTSMPYPRPLGAAPPSPPPIAAATPRAETDRSASVAPATAGDIQRDDDPNLPSTSFGPNGEIITATPGQGAGEDEDGEAAPAPTTRSKTAPTRKQPTPPRFSPASDDKTRVLTLSDVIAARDVLAERANAHWMKGLGGGQNKESETIVNFLYKMKVGPGRLLRVYNPAFPAYGSHPH